jgi:F-type H+-transporting ATPase subunit delta
VSVVHRVYARSLHDAAKGRGRLSQVREELGDFVQALEQVPELNAMLRNPQIDKRTKSEALDAVLGEGEEVVRNFLRVLAEKGRAAEVAQIREELERLVAKEEGQLSVELTTAFELSDEDAKSIAEQIEQASGRRVETTRRVDPDLIGGVVLQAGSLRLDGSVRGRLERLRQELTTRT